MEFGTLPRQSRTLSSCTLSCRHSHLAQGHRPQRCPRAVRDNRLCVADSALSRASGPERHRAGQRDRRRNSSTQCSTDARVIHLETLIALALCYAPRRTATASAHCPQAGQCLRLSAMVTAEFSDGTDRRARCLLAESRPSPAVSLLRGWRMPANFTAFNHPSQLGPRSAPHWCMRDARRQPNPAASQTRRGDRV